MTPMDAELDRLKATHLDAVFARIEAAIARSFEEDSSIPEMLVYHFGTGGKRLRALLPLMVAEALDCDPEGLVAFGAACEMIHNATLVHDDLQDGDRLRRGEEAIWVRYGAARAINLGDAMLYLGDVLIEDLDVDPGTHLSVLARVSRNMLRVIDGQEREFLLKEEAAPDLNAYFRMVQGKTSGLFALPIAGAALICGAPDELVEGLERVSGHLGIIFQIQDDILDLYGDKGREQAGGDIYEGKISALVAHFLTEAPTDEARWLRTLLSTPREDVDPTDVTLAIGRLREAGSLAFAFHEIERRKAL
ncbi:MAG: polyprenyl synthetase family protein, partial [Bradymonadaceae bacterium]